MLRIIALTMLLFLCGCVSVSQVNQEFYGGLNQGSEEYTEVLGNLSTYIGMYEGSTSMLDYAEWRDSVFEESNTLVGKARFLYSITETYCPHDEEILCEDIKTLYIKTRDMHGSLMVAVERVSDDQMKEAIRKFDDVLAHIESMESGK